MKYLPYDERAAEFEILTFSRRLFTGVEPSVSFWQRCLRRIRNLGYTNTSVKVVFVLDELDKLEWVAGADKVPPLTPILQSLKTVLAASSMSFIFIGGKEAEEQLVEDVSHGDSIYESIFSYNLYLPCLRTDQEKIMERCRGRRCGPKGLSASTAESYCNWSRDRPFEIVTSGDAPRFRRTVMSPAVSRWPSARAQEKRSMP